MEDSARTDGVAVITLASLFFMGLFTISHATKDYSHSSFVMKQLIWFSVGGLLFLWIKQWNYRFLVKHAFPIYVAGILFLVSVFVLGKKVNGALSWIDLGFLRLQPSEFVKISTLIMLGKIYEQSGGVIHQPKQLAKMAISLFLPTFIVLIQPDLGMALIYLAMLGCIFMLARLPAWVHVTSLVSVAIFVALLFGLYSFSPDAFHKVIRPHQFDRLISFIHPEQDPLGSGYQYMQAKKFVGSGQLTGAGVLLMLSTTVSLPEKHTDFIFAVIAHHWGFIGASILLMLYFVLFYRFVHWAMKTKDIFASFFISGMVTMWSFQIFVNIGMNIGLSPITGLTLPFISYGGSSLVSNLAALGLIYSMQHPKPHWFIE